MCKSVDTRKRNSYFTGCRSGMIRSVVVLLLNALALASIGTKVLCGGAQGPEPKITVVYWTVVRTAYWNGKKTIGPKCETWVKYPDKRRMEQLDGGQVCNGYRRWEYNRKLNIYTYEESDPKKVGAYPKTPFTLGQERKGWLSKGKSSGGTTEREMKAVFKGVEYPAIEMMVPLRQPSVGGESPESHERVVLYEYPETGLLRAKVVESYGPDGKLQMTDEYEYEYDKHELSDDFFVFKPPPGAKKLDHWPTKADKQ